MVANILDRWSSLIEIWQFIVLFSDGLAVLV